MSVTPFQAKVLRSLRSEGLLIRRVVRIYPPYDIGDPQEVLLIASDNKAGTCWVDAKGELIHGPVPGFGPML